MRREGKTALVTGAAQGIGAAIAEAFVREGARVIVSDINGEGAARVAPSLKQRHETLDVRRAADWTYVIDAILAREGRLDCLVNNAGITGFDGAGAPHDPEHAALEDWRAVHAANSTAFFLAASMRSARCGAPAPDRSSTCPRAPASPAIRALAPTLPPRRTCAIMQSRSRFPAPRGD